MRRTKVYQKYTKFNSMCIHRYVIIGSGKFLRSNARCVVPFSTPTAATITNNLNTHPHSVSHFTSTNIILLPSPKQHPTKKKHNHPTATLHRKDCYCACFLLNFNVAMRYLPFIVRGSFPSCSCDNSSAAFYNTNIVQQPSATTTSSTINN